MDSPKALRWLPLESNPDVMNKFVRNLGVPGNWQLVDVLGLDPDLLQLVPRPVIAVLLLFPINEKYEEFSKEQSAELTAKGYDGSPDVYFMKQTIRNACGTIALIHAIGNNDDNIQLDSEKCLKKFIEDTKSLSPELRGVELEKNQEIADVHDEHAQEGQTEAPGPDEAVNLHFVALVNVNGELYELDGRKEFPVAHGPTSEQTLLEDAAKVCQDFLKRDPDEVRFTVVALGAAHGDHN